VIVVNNVVVPAASTSPVGPPDPRAYTLADGSLDQKAWAAAWAAYDAALVAPRQDSGSDQPSDPEDLGALVEDWKNRVQSLFGGDSPAAGTGRSDDQGPRLAAKPGRPAPSGPLPLAGSPNSRPPASPAFQGGKGFASAWKP
jgi:hypothetical protein